MAVLNTMSTSENKSEIQDKIDNPALDTDSEVEDDEDTVHDLMSPNTATMFSS